MASQDSKEYQTHPISDTACTESQASKKICVLLQPEVVNAALVTVEQISSSLKGREMLAGNTQIPKNIAMKALGLSGTVFYF